MKFVVAMDSFKGSLSAVEACRAVADGIRAARPDFVAHLCPLADGGEGTVDTVVAARGGRWIEQEVMGPLPDRKVIAKFGELPDSCSLVEMAQASGLELLASHELDPLSTTTYGTGELVAAAISRQPRKVWLAVGGSATVDGGVGAAMALGWRFCDAHGQEIGLGGGELGKIHSITPPLNLDLPAIEVLCDVDNPLCGPRGAARVFGPQKGADPATVEVLEGNLANLADVVERELGIELREMAGAGAAGGLAGGAVAFLNAKLVSGIEAVMEATALARQIADADWVITGEGRFDRQSLDGKVVSGVLRLARQAGCRVGVLAGSVELSAGDIDAAGIDVAEASKPDDLDLDAALGRAYELLTAAGKRLAERAA